MYAYKKNRLNFQLVESPPLVTLIYFFFCLIFTATWKRTTSGRLPTKCFATRSCFVSCKNLFGFNLKGNFFLLLLSVSLSDISTFHLDWAQIPLFRSLTLKAAQQLDWAVCPVVGYKLSRIESNHKWYFYVVSNVLTVFFIWFAMKKVFVKERYRLDWAESFQRIE